MTTKANNMFGIPDIEKKSFRNNFINRVAVAGTYKANRSCTAQRQALKDRYSDTLPMQSDNPQQQYRINIDVKTNQTSVDSNVDDSDRQVTLRSKNMQKELTLFNNNFRYHESGVAYSFSTTFDEAVQPAIDYLKEVGVDQLNMMKLQKTNVIGYEMAKQTPEAGPIPAWQPASNLINPRLVPQYEAMLGTAQKIKQHISNIQLNDNDYVLTVKYGFNLTETKQDGSMVKGQVILDLEIERKASITIGAVADELQMMHRELYNAFLWSISENFLNLLNQEGEASA